MEHMQATIGKHPIHDMEMVSREVLPEQLIDILEPPLAPNLTVNALPPPPLPPPPL
jgi:hypothetical protein